MVASDATWVREACQSVTNKKTLDRSKVAIRIIPEPLRTGIRPIVSLRPPIAIPVSSTALFHEPGASRILVALA